MDNALGLAGSFVGYIYRWTKDLDRTRCPELALGSSDLYSSFSALCVSVAVEVRHISFTKLEICTVLMKGCYFGSVCCNISSVLTRYSSLLEKDDWGIQSEKGHSS